MPRLTRKALAESTPPSRSSPRASTKASTAAAGSSSPAKKTRGRGGKAEEEPESLEVETKTRGRSASRGKDASPAARQSRSRGRSGSAAKKTPARKGRGKAKEEEEEPEEEEEEQEEEEAAEAEEEKEEKEVTPTRGRGRGRGRSPASAEKKTPARGSRSSRRSAEPAAEEEEEIKKSTPRGRGRGRSTSASTPKSRSRRGRGAGEPEEEGEGAEEEEEKEKVDDADEQKMDEGAEVDKTEETEKATPAEKKEEPESKKAEPGALAEKKEEAEKVSTPAKAASATSVEPMEEDTKNGDAAATQPSPAKAGMKRKIEEEEISQEKEEPDVKRARINGTESDNMAAGSAGADVEMTDSKPAEEGDELKDFVVVSKEEVPAPDSAEVAASLPRPVEEVKVTPASAPPPLPDTGAKAAEVTPPVITDSLKVIPLTEAEMAKAYASEKAAERSESDDVSSTIVEVGSVAGSDITGGQSRGLDISEVQSSSNSIDGDFAGDTSLNEGVVTPDNPAPGFPSPVPQAPVNTSVLPPPEARMSSAASVPQPPLGVQPAVNLPPAPALNPTLNAMPGVPPVNSNSGAVPPPLQQVPAPTVAPQQQSIPATLQLPASSIPLPPTTSLSSAQNSQPPVQLGKGSSSVSESLGRPDPAFLAAYSSPSILNRAYVPNPAVTPDRGSPSNQFSVVTYNILAECHRVNSDYSYTPTEFLTQEYRHALMMKELQYLNGDIVCLQEVNPAYYNTTLLPAMRSLGYDGLLKCRTKPGFDEGEATFYKTQSLELEASKGVSLGEAALKEVEQGGLTPEVGAAISKYLDRADVVLITRFRSKMSGKVLTVGNIHVVWDALRSPDVQCIQAACAIKEVVGMAGSDGAHIICGDFNSEWNSPVYQLVLDGYLSDSSIHTLQAVQRLELNDGAKSLVNHLWRAFQHTSSNLKSAYATVTKSEPEVTTYTGKMKKSVDFIFYSAGALVPTGVLKTLDRAVVDATGGLPNRDIPSDHLSLTSVMVFTK